MVSLYWVADYRNATLRGTASALTLPAALGILSNTPLDFPHRRAVGAPMASWCPAGRYRSHRRTKGALMRIARIEAFQVQWRPEDPESSRSAFVRVWDD